MMIVVMGPMGPAIIDLPPHSSCNNSYGPPPAGWGPEDSKYVHYDQETKSVFFDYAARSPKPTALAKLKKGYFG